MRPKGTPSSGTWAAVFFGIALAFFAMPARADVERFAVIVGDNKGDGNDGDLRYAESDAQKMYDVLKDLGGFAPTDMVLLRGENAATVTKTLITVNDRIRTAMTREGTQIVLFFYFSGHADASALHLAGTRFDLVQLEQLVRGSAATLRVLMLDACRSGALTRLKGGRSAAPFALDLSARIDACHASGSNDTLTSIENEFGGELHASRAFDLPIVTVSFGLGLGGSWMHQSLDTRGIAPSRDTPAGRLAASFGLAIPLFKGLSIVAESSAVTYVFALERAESPTKTETSLGPWFSFRQLVGLEKEW